jgi:hypothetical protein
MPKLCFCKILKYQKNTSRPAAFFAALFPAFPGTLSTAKALVYPQKSSYHSGIEQRNIENVTLLARICLQILAARLA